MTRACEISVVCVICLAAACVACGEDWPQFRGPGARGVAMGQAAPPVDIAPGRHVLWQTPIAPGHSSPVVVGDRVYLTAHDAPNLLTLALDRDTGEILWRAQANYEALEPLHKINGPATPTVAADQECVVSLFGSCGLFCHGRDGTPRWHVPMGPFDDSQGAASSPILVDDRVIVLEDHDTGSFLAAYDKRTGREEWRVERPDFRRNYSTPTVWSVDGRKQIVTVGSARVTAYDAEDGRYLWSISGVARVTSSTPVVSEDGMLYLATSGGASEATYPSFEQAVAASDTNGDGLLSGDELPAGPLRSYQDQFDRNKDLLIDGDEYESIRRIMSLSRDVAMAVRAGGVGDVTKSHVAWSMTRNVPRNASPALVDGTLFLIKDGGILTSLDARTGRVLKQGRTGDVGYYFASPVVGGGAIYLFNQAGQLTVASANPKWEVLAKADFGEDVLASPAIVDGRVYVRTAKRLYCFSADQL